MKIKIFRGSKTLGKHSYYIGICESDYGNPEAGEWLTAPQAKRLVARLEKMIVRLEKKNKEEE